MILTRDFGCSVQNLARCFVVSTVLLGIVGVGQGVCQAQPTAADTASQLMSQAAQLARAGKYEAAGDLYTRAAAAFTAQQQTQESAKASGEAATMYEKQADELLTGAKAAPSPANPQAPVAAPPKVAPRPVAIKATPRPQSRPKQSPPNSPLPKLPPLAPRPGYIIGRAVFEDGRPIESFTTYAAGVAGSGRGVGHNGRYEMKLDPVLLISDVSATTTLSYRGKQFEMTLHPFDGLPNGYGKGCFRGQMSRGIVRDFVLKMSGIDPYHSLATSPEYDVNTEATHFYYGGSLSVGCSYGKEGAMVDDGTSLLSTFPKGKVILTLSPTGPRLDNSTGTQIVREFPVGLIVHLYNIPIGIYSATAQLRAPNGSLHALRLSTCDSPYNQTAWKSSLHSSVSVEWKSSYGSIAATQLYAVE